MKKLRFLIVIGLCSTLLGGGIPREEGLSIDSLGNGVQLWLKEQAFPSQSISCRIVAKNPHEGLPQVFSMDCPLEAFEDELSCLIDTCKESLSKEAEYHLAVMAVGDFDKKQLGKFLAEAVEVFSKRDPLAPPRPLSIHSSPQASKMVLSLYYRNALQELKTDQDVKRLWATYLLQAMVQERFRKVVTDEGGQVLAAPEIKYMLSTTHSMVHSKLVPPHDPALFLTKCLKALQEIKKSGFTDKELSGAKSQLQNKLSLFYQRSPDNAALADHLASHFALGSGCPDYTVFMTMSFKIIGDLEMQDVLGVMGETFKDADRRVEITAPTGVSEASILAVCNELRADDIAFIPGSLEVPDMLKKGREVFAQLSLTEPEKERLYELIDTLGKTHWSALAFKAGRLEDLGRSIRHIHPLKFLEIVFSNSRLKKAMGEIFSSDLKRNGFLKGSSEQPGFGDKMGNEFNHKNLFPYLLGFSQAVNASPDQIRGFFERNDWRGLVEFLINL